MTSYFSSDYNAINLLRNGGLDFVGTNSELPFWTIEGAGLRAVPPLNSYEVITRTTQEAENGAAKYLRFYLSSDEPVILTQEFSNRFIQMGFTYRVGDSPWVVERGAEPRLPGEKRYVTFDCLLVRGSPVTLSFSLRVPQGRASVKMSLVLGSGAYMETPIQNGVSSKDWLRPATSIDPATERISRLKIVLQRDAGAGTTEIHLGALMLAAGVASSLPYTGDPMADAIPKGTIVFAFGSVCPPGFEKLSFKPPMETGRVFFKNGTPDLEVKGEETHDHSSARISMNPERGWPTMEIVSPGTNNAVPGDSGKKAHNHSIEAGSHVPPTKDVILCKRI